MAQLIDNKNIERDGNVITILKCNHSKCASDFLRHLKAALSKGYKDIVIKSIAEAIYPNACLPIAGMIQYFESQDINFTYELNTHTYLMKCGFTNPVVKNREELQTELNPFDKIFRYETSGQVADLTQAYINAISRQSICEQGVIDGMIWCLNEVMDNVLLHSQSEYGLVMAQYHPVAKHVVFCVYDSGTGIYNTLRDTKHRPMTEIDALSLAVQEGVGDGKGQGNGLFGLYQIIKDNRGRLTITSGASSMMLQDDGILNKFEHIPFVSNRNKGTIIDFQLDLNKNIDIKKLFSTIGGFDGFDVRIDDMLDDNYCIRYDVFDNAQGTATRESGKHLRNDVENILKRRGAKIILDFSRVQTVSSSFIDEFIAKMVLDIGFLNFNSLINLKNMNPSVSFLCQRSLYMRIHEEWKDKKEEYEEKIVSEYKSE